MRPTPKHIFLFAGLTGLGTLYVVYSSWPITELNLLLENLTFVVALGAGWATILGDTIMFVEKYFEIKEENLRRQGRQSLAKKFRSLISSTDGDTLPKDDLLKILEEDDNE